MPLDILTALFGDSTLDKIGTAYAQQRSEAGEAGRDLARSLFPNQQAGPTHVPSLLDIPRAFEALTGIHIPFTGTPDSPSMPPAQDSSPNPPPLITRYVDP